MKGSRESSCLRQGRSIEGSWIEQDFKQWEGSGEGSPENAGSNRLPCPPQIIIRSRHARTPWESVVKAVVGNPVHVDVVLAKEGSAGARFCFSSYMNHKFEMSMMDQSMIHDSYVSNLALSVTDQELERCTKFLTALEGKAAYSYFDAFVLMPMAPKVSSRGFSKSLLGTLTRLR